eukprot:14751338-Alexandrium_andersonii.AAC.1
MRKYKTDAHVRAWPCVKCKIVARVRTWNRASPGLASKLAPEAPEGCVLRCPSHRLRIRRRSG